MIISIIAILLLAKGVFSSLPVHGSISIIHDNTMLIDLRANKSNVNNDLDEVIEKLRGMKEPQIYLLIDLGREVIEIEETNPDQDYFKVGNDNEKTLQLMTLMQEHDSSHKMLTHQNSISHIILRHASQEVQDSIDFDKDCFVSSWILSDPEFLLEMERILRNELSFEYAKSVQNVLLWLIKLFDIKLQLHDLDLISRWRLLNLQRQVKFLLENLIIDNQRYEEPKDEILENESNSISDNEKFKIGEVILTEQNKENLTETNKTEINIDKDRKNTPSDISFKENTQNINHSELLKRTEDDTIDNNSTTVKIPISPKSNMSTNDNSIINDTFFSETKTLRDEDLIKKESFSNSKKFTGSLRDENTKHNGKLLNQLKNVPSISPTENITSALQETDQMKSIEADAISHESLKNLTDIRKTPFRRTLQVPSNKSKEKNRQKEKDGHMSVEKLTDKHHYFNERMEIKSDNGSAMDEILEAVDEVLPTDKSVEISPKG